jgi:hypothetical protein
MQTFPLLHFHVGTCYYQCFNFGHSSGHVIITNFWA